MTDDEHAAKTQRYTELLSKPDRTESEAKEIMRLSMELSAWMRIRLERWEDQEGRKT